MPSVLLALSVHVHKHRDLDVYEHEPKVPAALMALGNVVLAPHLGTATRNARDAMGMRVIANIEAFLSTGSPGDQA